MILYDKLGIMFWVLILISAILILTGIVYAEPTEVIEYPPFDDNVRVIASSLTG